MTPQDTYDVSAARTAKALAMIERALRALYGEDLRGVEIELRAALAELPLDVLHLKEQTGSHAPAMSRIENTVVMMERARRALYGEDIRGAEIELNAALAELPLIALYLNESSAP